MRAHAVHRRQLGQLCGGWAVSACLPPRDCLPRHGQAIGHESLRQPSVVPRGAQSPPQQCFSVFTHVDTCFYIQYSTRIKADASPIFLTASSTCASLACTSRRSPLWRGLALSEEKISRNKLVRLLTNKALGLIIHPSTQRTASTGCGDWQQRQGNAGSVQ